MHKRTRADLLPLDTKLENTLINLKKERTIEETSTMVEQRETNKNLPIASERPQQR